MVDILQSVAILILAFAGFMNTMMILKLGKRIK